MELRRNHIAYLLTELITNYPQFTVAEILQAVLRRKNFTRGKCSGLYCFEAYDEQLSIALENTLTELKNELSAK